MPPSHFPRCSVTDIFSEVFRQSENRDARKASRFFLFGRKYLCGIDKIHCFYILETYVTCGHRPLRSAFGGVRPTRRCGAGGYAIRPYEHAPGPLVGAAFMAARTRFRFPPRFDDSARRRGAHGASATLRVQGTPPAALSSVHAVGADCISARAAPPVNVHFIPCGRCAMPGDRRKGRLQRARRSRSGARRWNKSSGPGTAP